MRDKGHIHWHDQTVKKQDRQTLHGHKSFIIWLTGLSGAGKSTVANQLEKKLFDLGYSTYLLDGDNIRSGLNADLTFASADRKENIRRISEVAKLFVDAGTIVLTAFISPYKEDRAYARRLVGTDEFIEVYVKCALETCERRDPKGLYQLARSGEISDFTGISAPYEAPLNPEIVIDSEEDTVEDNVDTIINWLEKNGYV